MTTPHPIVILGTGLAGYTLAREIRKRDPDIALTLVTADDGVFYSKPMLSSALAQGKTAQTLRNTEATAMAAELRATLLTHTPVTAIDRATHEIVCADGARVAYSALVLALGAQPIRLPITGDGAQDVLSVNNLTDYARYESKLAHAQDIAVIGAGLIGCEFANDLTQSGRRVTVFDVSPQPLGRLLPPGSARLLQSKLEEAGVRFMLQDSLDEITRHGKGYQLRTQSGHMLTTDLVVSAVGLRPDTALASAAGLATGRGVLTNALLATSDAQIFALGDCAEVEGQVLPYVMPIMHGARALAATLTGTPQPLVYPPMPVLVKTTICPVVVCPPKGAGSWQEDVSATGASARHTDETGRLTGFALVGDRTPERAARLKEMVG